LCYSRFRAKQYAFAEEYSGFIAVVLASFDAVDGFLPRARPAGQFRLAPAGAIPRGDAPAASTITRPRGIG
jgi:hypothetical protein